MALATHCEQLTEVSALVNAEFAAALELLKNTSGELTDYETLLVAKAMAVGMSQPALAMKPLVLEACDLESQNC
jgi:hypothetical protein